MEECKCETVNKKITTGQSLSKSAMNYYNIHKLMLLVCYSQSTDLYITIQICV